MEFSRDAACFFWGVRAHTLRKCTVETVVASEAALILGNKYKVPSAFIPVFIDNNITNKRRFRLIVLVWLLTYCISSNLFSLSVSRCCIGSIHYTSEQSHCHWRRSTGTYCPGQKCFFFPPAAHNFKVVVVAVVVIAAFLHLITSTNNKNHNGNKVVSEIV